MNDVTHLDGGVALSATWMDMFTKELKQGDHVRRFSISEAPTEGWEVREEADSEVVRMAHYRDWHRVERARMRIDEQVTDLERRGWR